MSGVETITVRPEDGPGRLDRWFRRHYPGLSHTEIFDSVETFYRSFYFRPSKIAALVGEMVKSPEVMKRRLREGAEFFRFLLERHEMAHRSI